MFDRIPGLAAANQRAAIPAAVVLLIAVVLLQGISRGEFHLNVDETHHAATGLYFADLLSDFPAGNIIEYTYRYYAQYPALGLIHWPPLFHFVEGIAFLVLGPSVVTARLTVLLFALVGFVFWFKLVEEVQGPLAAGASTLLLAFLPSLLLFEKSVMLEVPSLALCIAASYFWLKFLREEAPRFLYAFALFWGLALLTKQNSIYLALFCLISAITTGKWRLIVNRLGLRAALLFVALVGPFYALSTWIHSQTITSAALMGSGLATGPASAYYPGLLPDQLGWPVLVLSLAGLFTWRWWAARDSAVTMFIWIVSCYLTFTLIAEKSPRLILYWLPPFTFFAVGPLTARLTSMRVRPIAYAALVAVLGFQTSAAWAYERPYVSGYGAAARHVAGWPSPEIVLFDGSLPGNFIFHLRAADPERRKIVLRKALYVTRIMPQYGSLHLVNGADEIKDLIRRFGIRRIVVEQGGPLDFPAQLTLREVLRSEQFRLAKTFPLDSNMPEWRARSLAVYENLSAAVRTERNLRLRMLTLGQDIVVPLDEWGDSGAPNPIQ